MVIAGLEKIRIAIGAKLVAFLLAGNGVQPALNIGHGRIEDQNVRAEIRNVEELGESETRFRKGNAAAGEDQRGGQRDERNAVHFIPS